MFTIEITADSSVVSVACKSACVDNGRMTFDARVSDDQVLAALQLMRSRSVVRVEIKDSEQIWYTFEHAVIVEATLCIDQRAVDDRLPPTQIVLLSADIRQVRA